MCACVIRVCIQGSETIYVSYGIKCLDSWTSLYFGLHIAERIMCQILNVTHYTLQLCDLADVSVFSVVCIDALAIYWCQSNGFATEMSFWLILCFFQYNLLLVFKCDLNTLVKELRSDSKILEISLGRTMRKICGRFFLLVRYFIFSFWMLFSFPKFGIREMYIVDQTFYSLTSWPEICFGWVFSGTLLCGSVTNVLFSFWCFNHELPILV